MNVYGNELQAFGGGVQYVSALQVQREDEISGKTEDEQQGHRSAALTLFFGPFGFPDVGRVDGWEDAGGIIGVSGNIFSLFGLTDIVTSVKAEQEILGVGGNFLQSLGAFISTLASSDEPYTLAYLGGVWQFVGAGLQGIAGLIKGVDWLNIFGSWVQFLGALFVAIAIMVELEIEVTQSRGAYEGFFNQIC
ncbi:hypothetical protein AB990_19525 [Alkalihalobacillus pseudalcaliphilus]|nr:hypothetical protein AB990_19525 [Alkalihalobacillus pseudalcaliphilus]